MTASGLRHRLAARLEDVWRGLGPEFREGAASSQTLILDCARAAHSCRSPVASMLQCSFTRPAIHALCSISGGRRSAESIARKLLELVSTGLSVRTYEKALRTPRLRMEQLDNKVKGASRICLLGDHLLRVSGCSTQDEQHGTRLRS